LSPRPLRLVFAGTPEFSVPCLEACRASGAEVVAVYTQPDRPAGRGRRLTPSPVKQAALATGLAVEQPESVKPAEVQQGLADYRPDLLVVVAYGLILPRKVLAIPRLGCWNVHASLLPRWRGAAPIQRAILAGDAESGVDLMRMEAGLDTGPVLLERRTPISRDDTGGSLHDRLSMLGADVLAEGLRRTLAGETLAATPQPEDGVTYAHKLDKTEARLDLPCGNRTGAPGARVRPVAGGRRRDRRRGIADLGGTRAGRRSRRRSRQRAGGRPRRHRHRLRPGRLAYHRGAACRRQAHRYDRLPQRPS